MADLTPAREAPDAHTDALVIGAGFAGLRMLHELKQLGRTARVLEAGPDVGGTWFWNRYPGARTDSESWVFCYSFDDALLQEWDWSARFPVQSNVLDYLRHVADRFALRQDIVFNARVASAHYDEARNIWVVRTAEGEEYTCRTLIAATGFLSVAYQPPFAGLDEFEGEWFLTARWPEKPVDFAGKRVAVIGTGATGIQVIPEIAHNAEHLTVLQRTAQYAVPNRNHPLEQHQKQAIKANYDAIWQQCRRQAFAFPIDRAGRKFADVSPEEQQRILDAGWEAGGFRFIFETFDDIVTDSAANEAACEYVRGKIRAIVKDPKTADLLCPYDHPIGAKRVPLSHQYYETYNRENVSLVSVRDNPIVRITPKGILLADGTEIVVDMIVFAIGFDAATGALGAVDIRGRDDRSLADEWRNGPRTFMGLATEGFPNMFMMFGPHTPLANAPVLIEEQARWIGGALTYMEKHDFDRMEVTADAVERFSKKLQAALDATLLGDAAGVRSYYLGANIPGKQHSILVYLAGAARYFQEIGHVADQDFAEFRFDSVQVAQPAH